MTDGKKGKASLFIGRIAGGFTKTKKAKPAEVNINPEQLQRSAIVKREYNLSDVRILSEEIIR